MSEDFVLDLIVAEEEASNNTATPQNNNTNDDSDTGSTVSVIKMEDITRSSQFIPVDLEDTTSDDTVNEMPINGSGVLDNIIIRADSKNFSIKFEVDNSIIYDDHYNDLEEISIELNNFSAYESNGIYTINIDDYPFSEFVNLTITPHDEITFDLVRVESTKR